MHLQLSKGWWIENFNNNLGKFVLVYLDDVLVFSKTHEEHLEHLRKVFNIQCKNNIYVKLTNYYFVNFDLEYLGHVVGKDEIKFDPSWKIDIVTRWARHNDVSHLRSFLGLCNWFRRFIQGYSILVPLLTHLTRKDVKYIWIGQYQESFEIVKYASTDAPFLNLQIFGKRFEVICDVFFVGYKGSFFYKNVAQLCLKARSLHLLKKIIPHVNKN